MDMTLISKNFYETIHLLIPVVARKYNRKFKIEFLSLEYKSSNGARSSNMDEFGSMIPLAASATVGASDFGDQIHAGYQKLVLDSFHWSSYKKCYFLEANNKITIRRIAGADKWREVIISFDGWPSNSIKRKRCYKLSLNEIPGIHYIAENDFVMEYEFAVEETEVVRYVKKPGSTMEIPIRAVDTRYVVTVNNIIFSTSWLSTTLKSSEGFVVLDNAFQKLRKEGELLNIRSELVSRYRMLEFRDQLTAFNTEKLWSFMRKFHGFADRRFLLDYVVSGSNDFASILPYEDYFAFKGKLTQYMFTDTTQLSTESLKRIKETADDSFEFSGNRCMLRLMGICVYLSEESVSFFDLTSGCIDMVEIRARQLIGASDEF